MLRRQDMGGLYMLGHMICEHKSSFTEANVKREGDCMCETGWSGMDCEMPVCASCQQGQGALGHNYLGATVLGSHYQPNGLGP